MIGLLKRKTGRKQREQEELAYVIDWNRFGNIGSKIVVNG